MMEYHNSFTYTLKGEDGKETALDVLFSEKGKYIPATREMPEEFPELTIDHVYYKNTTESPKLSPTEEDDIYEYACEYSQMNSFYQREFKEELIDYGG